MIFFNIIRDFPAHTEACTNVQAVEAGRIISLQSLTHYQKLFFSILKPHNISFEQFNDLKIRLVKKLHMQKFILVEQNMENRRELMIRIASAGRKVLDRSDAEISRLVAKLQQTLTHKETLAQTRTADKLGDMEL